MNAGGERNVGPIPVERLSWLPSFCVPILQDDDPSLATWINFWAVEASSDAAADEARGEAYADEAIQCARDTGQPEIVDCVIIWMNIALCDAQVHPGPLENGFMKRIARDDPQTIDRMIARVFEQYPQLRN